MGEPLCGVAAQQFVKSILWSTIKLAETGVNLEPIIDDSGPNTLRARHFAAGDKFLEHGPPDAYIARRFVGTETASGEVDNDALASSCCGPRLGFAAEARNRRLRHRNLSAATLRSNIVGRGCFFHLIE